MILTVGYNQQFPSIQHAVNYLVAYLSNPVLTETVIIEVYSGNYGGVIIPASSIFPTSTYKLIIKAKPGHNVVLSGLITSTDLGHGYSTIGIGIGDNTPNVNIVGIKIENFHKGIVFSGLCNRGVVKNCLFRMNANVGLWIYRSEECQVINNALLDHSNSVVCSEINEIVIAHNDIINLTDPPMSSQFNKHCLHITTKQPSSYSPNGTIAIYNNNFASNGGTLIAYDSNVVPKLRSNYNNFDYSNCVVGKNLHSNTLLNTLTEWQTAVNQDQNSITTTVNYYTPTQIGSSLFTNINLANYLIYGGVAKGLSTLCNSTLAASGTTYLALGSLPYYSDTAAYCQTIQSNYGLAGLNTGISINRPPIVSIGAYDSNIDNNGFASSIVAPIQSVSNGVSSPSCEGGKYTSVNVIEEKFSQSVECIHPKVKAGYFYVNDAQYYLYASKAAYEIKDITWSEFALSAELINIPSDGTNGIKVIYDNNTLDNNDIIVTGNKILISHKNLELSDWNNHIHIIGTVLKWDTSGFKSETLRHTFRIRDGTTRYLLPDKPTRGAPVVITDDKVTYSDDPELLNREFKLVEDTKLDKIEVLFSGPDNLIDNPQFDEPDYFYTGYNFLAQIGYGARGWAKSGDIDCWIVDKLVTTNNDTTYSIASGRRDTGSTIDGSLGENTFNTGFVYTIKATGSYDLYPVIGRYMYGLFHGIDSNSNTYQTVRMDDNRSYWLSAYVASVKEPGEIVNIKSEDIAISWYFYNNNFNLISNTGISIAITSDYRNVNTIWNRVAIPYSNIVDETVGKSNPGDVIIPASMLVNPFPIPSGTYYTKLCFSATGFVCIDAVSLTQDKDLYPYRRNYRYKDCTIEYDAGASDLYSLDDLTITSARNSNSNGFLHIPAIPARQFDTNALENITTLTDWYWPTGRLLHLPWAKTSGKNKLNYRSSFNLEPKLPYEDITISPIVGYPETIEIIPRIPISNLKDGIGPSEQIAVSNNDPSPGIKGTDILIKVTDSNGNPYAFESITCSVYNDINNPESYRFNGYLGVKELGIFTQYNSTITTKLDSAGSTTIRWIPPSSDEASITINNPSTQIKSTVVNGVNYYYIDDLPFRINPMSAGNIFMSTPLRPNGYKLYDHSAYDVSITPTSFRVDTSSVYGYYLPGYPYKQSLKVFANYTGISNATGSTSSQLAAYDLELSRSLVPEISDGQFYFDETKNILFASYTGPSVLNDNSLKIQYSPLHAYTMVDDDGVINQKRLYITPTLYNRLIVDINSNNPLTISYDIVVNLIVRTDSPGGMQVNNSIINTNTGDIYINAGNRIGYASMIGKSIPVRIGL